ncbi:hypothetical protein U9M48_037066 [Paspalum notatum var. saurae]|uniref:Uncharacterized protein n=1 Tax=Paspalum notatum var. saurae TaxID=547442 RepID=A0AAQ3UKE4_PASNO
MLPGVEAVRVAAIPEARNRAAPRRRPEKLSEDLDEDDYFDTTRGFGDKLDDDLFFDGRR